LVDQGATAINADHDATTAQGLWFCLKEKPWALCGDLADIYMVASLLREGACGVTDDTIKPAEDVSRHREWPRQIDKAIPHSNIVDCILEPHLHLPVVLRQGGLMHRFGSYVNRKINQIGASAFS
jgi:hypothetical protein